MKILLPLAVILLIFPLQFSAQIVLAEAAPTNTGQITDEDDDQPDWMEIFNAGSVTVNLSGMGLSDNTKPKWIFPEYFLAAGERIIVFASGKNRGGFGQSDINHWETAINEDDQWKLFIGTEAPPSDWANTTFDAASWTTAMGGFGYGDNDDETIIPDSTLSFYYRRTFSVTNSSALDSAILSMDYDDGFVAYLNGVEIARSSNMPPGTPDFTTLTDTDHEAQMYGGGDPVVFPISSARLTALLVPGQNVLAIEVHNVEPASSDLSARTWLHFGIRTTENFYGPNPPFFSDISVSNFHTGFKIGFGETIRLFGVDGTQLDSVNFSFLQPGHSMMRTNDTGDWCITDSPTPEEANVTTCFSTYADTPIISPMAGFYQADQTIVMSGSAIRYTLDGSEPVDTSTIYSSPFTVSANAIVRARSFEPGKLPGSTATATYFINESSTLPVLSITAKPGDMFDDGTGGLAAYDDYNSGRKAPVHLEYFDKEKNLAFTENASLKPVGGYSIAFDQKSMQFSFDEEFGARDDVHYPIFQHDKPFITDYREFRVRNMDDDWSTTRIRDVVANQLAAPTHCATTGYQQMLVFINGEYWGHYGGREVTNKYYVRDNHGSDPEEVDQILTSYFEADKYLVDEGTGDDFFAMSEFIIQNDMNDPANFAAAKKRVDWENWVDYFATEMYLANGDWFSSVYYNNTRMYRAPGVPWRFILFDVTYAQGNGSSTDANILEEALGDPANPNLYTSMMNSLLANAEFKSYFINRFADLLNEYWSYTKTLAVIDSNAYIIANEINRQSERWGSIDSTEWQTEIAFLRDFHSIRPAYQRQQIQDYFELNNQVDIRLDVQPAGAGVIHINTIIPGKLPWSGIYFDGNPVTITAIANPGYSFDHWVSTLPVDPLSGTITLNLTEHENLTAHFTGSTQPVEIELSEINYQSDPTTDAGDWFELKNNASYPIDLSHYKVQDREWYHQFLAPAGTILQPGERLVIAEDGEQFTASHPGVLNVIGSAGFALDNQGDQIRLYNRRQESIFDASFDNSKPWPCTPAGFGRSLERWPGINDINQPESWFDGCMGGSPGVAFSPCVDDLIVSEINYHAAEVNDAGDWIEIKNQLSTPIDLSGWTVRDEDDDHTFLIPSGTTIAPGGYWVICESDSSFTAQHPNVPNKSGDTGFGLGNGGDVIRLYDAAGTLRLSICYDDDAPWNTTADGEGYTLELGDAYVNLNDPFNWFAGCLGGSPGFAYDPECIPVALEPVATNKAMTIFPNPVDDKLTLLFESATPEQITIVDAWGREVLTHNVQGEKLVFNLQSLSTGLYFVKTTLENQIVVERFIKK